MYVVILQIPDEPWNVRVYGPYLRETSAIKKSNEIEKNRHYAHSVGYFKLRKN
jgi:hypothetical protein